MGSSGFLFSCDRDLGVPIEFQEGSQASSHFEAWNSAFLWSWKRGVRLPVMFSQGTLALSRQAAGESDLSSCCEGILGIPFEQGNQALSRVEGKPGVLLSFGRNRGVLLKVQ